MMPVSPPIFLTGPTGSGKSSVALELARLLGNVEIVSADAFQVYRGMEILTAAPGEDAKRAVPHHLCSFLSPSSSWDAARHGRMAGEIMTELAQRGRRALVTGGSGLYVRFISHGVSPAPPSSPALRSKLDALPLDELVRRLGELDPEGARVTPLQNKRYVVRSLEIVLLGGKPLAHWRHHRTTRALGPGFTLVRETEDLNRRIARRAEAMLEAGAAREVAALGFLSSTAEKALGLAQIRAYLRGETSGEECAEALSLATRQYARRQRTWLRREDWLTPVPVAPGTSSAEIARAIAEHICR